jgi:hypothetical protein
LLLHALSVFLKGKKVLFVKITCDLKTSNNYAGKLSKRVFIDGELRGLKLHDYYVLM